MMNTNLVNLFLLNFTYLLKFQTINAHYYCQSVYPKDNYFHFFY
ncbi:hypothetical protein NTHI1209_02216 [Haemophilus influenzae]|uniref:Uncharacterized protein n=1 Tax=Haemophilus influenzae TaxID=727 RepID=A0A158T0B7_HAEIF|nr:hypothetical protein NTHI1209_02216 [Haemophilus influenzae]